jgi:hypothetical protein
MDRSKNSIANAHGQRTTEMTRLLTSVNPINVKFAKPPFKTFKSSPSLGGYNKPLMVKDNIKMFSKNF